MKSPNVGHSSILRRCCPDDLGPRGKLWDRFCVAVADASQRLVGFISLRPWQASATLSKRPATYDALILGRVGAMGLGALFGLLAVIEVKGAG
jgi:hypothetical protein